MVLHIIHCVPIRGEAIARTGPLPNKKIQFVVVGTRLARYIFIDLSYFSCHTAPNSLVSFIHRRAPALPGANRGFILLGGTQTTRQRTIERVFRVLPLYEESNHSSYVNGVGLKLPKPAKNLFPAFRRNKNLSRFYVRSMKLMSGERRFYYVRETEWTWTDGAFCHLVSPSRKRKKESI